MWTPFFKAKLRLDLSEAEIDLNECENRFSKRNWDRSKPKAIWMWTLECELRLDLNEAEIDLNECEHALSDMWMNVNKHLSQLLVPREVLSIAAIKPVLFISNYKTNRMKDCRGLCTQKHFTIHQSPQPPAAGNHGGIMARDWYKNGRCPNVNKKVTLQSWSACR